MERLVVISAWMEDTYLYTDTAYGGTKGGELKTHHQSVFLLVSSINNDTKNEMKSKQCLSEGWT